MRLRVLCDENVPYAVVASLKEWGFNVVRPQPGADDSKVAGMALREKRILITFDSDFANIIAYPPKDFFGVIRIAVKPPLIKSATNSLKQVFKSFRTARMFRGKLIIVEAASFRIRETPPHK